MSVWRRLRHRAKHTLMVRLHLPHTVLRIQAPPQQGTRFAGTGVVVTGAAGMLGADISRAFATEGAEVLALDVDEPGLDALVASAAGLPGSIRAIACDLTDTASIDLAAVAIAEGPAPAILVNNAGVNQPGRFFEGADDEQWRRIFAVCLFGAAHLTRRLLPGLRTAPDASILFIGSSNQQAASPWTAYAAAKAALAKLAEDLAAELAPEGIRVNTIAPGYVLDADPPHGAEFHPLHGVAMPPSAVTHAVLFLSDSSVSRFTTGAVLRVDSGTGIEMARVSAWRDARLESRDSRD
jgi:NAD(P)-dependent dehydrogenase (short-subunit alcohol dehydrogenase family)